MASPGQQLLAQFRQQLVQLLGDALASLDQAGNLGGDQRSEAFAGTALQDNVLEPISLGAAKPLVAVFDRVLPASPPDAAVLAGFHGWLAEQRGFAYAGRAGDLVFALAVTGSGPDARLSLHASGEADEAATALASGWTLTATGRVAGSLTATIAADGPAAVEGATPGDTLALELARDEPGSPLGVPGGPAVVLGAAALSARVDVAPDASAMARGSARLRGGSIRLVPGILAGVVPELGPIPLNLDLDADPERGVSLGGSTELRTQLGGAGVDLVLGVGGGDAGVDLSIGATRSLSVSIPGVPVAMDFRDLGLTLRYGFGPGALGFSPPLAAPPSGAGVKLDLPVVQGSGFLAHQENTDRYAGGLAVKLPPLSANAFGVLDAPHDGQPLSLIVLMSATFPPPGVQLGLGFSVTGLGGIVGVNRRVDRDALLRAVTDGSAAALLFPADPARAAPTAVGALGAIFPPARGSFVAGPMLQISWGGRLVSAQAAIVTEAAGQVRLAILGKLVVAVPDPAAPLILLQATFAGLVDPGEPSVTFVASLTGSHIVGLPLTGDMCLVTRGGGDPTFVLSAGGFHPAFTPPRGVPPMARLGMDLSPNPLIDLRCEGYFAITTNTVQFGALIELVAEVADCGLRGHLQFDVLFQWSPYLAFTADMAAGIAVEFAGEELAGIHLDLHVSGPTPWHVRGRGSIDLFLFDVSFPFDVEWGNPPPLPTTPPDVRRELLEALRARDAWTVHRSSRRVPVRLSPPADEALGRGALVDPHATLTARQRRVPLGLDIERFDRTPVPRQRWDIVAGQLGRDRPVALGAEVREPFAPGQYVEQTNDEALAERAFKPWRAGAELATGSIPRPEARPTTLDYEIDIEADDLPRIPFELPPVGTLPGIELLLSMGLRHPGWWEPPPPTERIVMFDAPPLTVASGWALQARADAPTATSLTELRQSPEVRPEALVVERWELMSA